MGTSATLQQINDDTIEVSGLIDFDSVLSCRSLGEEMIRSASSEELIFDLSKADISSNIGVSLMLCWLRYGAKKGKEIAFQGVPENLLEIIQVSGVEQILGLVEA
ncbi:MAG: STAS domain-containing protein [Pseudomonadales bacterium]|nr:STAS domain-containing protein [Pseudomonadales bacterium]